MILTKNNTEIKNVIRLNSSKVINHIKGPHDEAIWDRPVLTPNWLKVYDTYVQEGTGVDVGNIESHIEYTKTSGYAGESVTATVKIKITLAVKQYYGSFWYANTVFVGNGDSTPPDLVADLKGTYGPLRIPDYNGNVVTESVIELQKSFDGFIDGYYHNGELLEELAINITNVTRYAD
jgi:hypothetical protein